MARDTGQIQGRLDELRKRVDLLSLQWDVTGAPTGGPSAPGRAPGARLGAGPGPAAGGPGPAGTGGGGSGSLPPRSEERRVGEEWRARLRTGRGAEERTRV